MYTPWWKELWYRVYWRAYRCVEKIYCALGGKLAPYPGDDDVVEVAPGVYELKNRE